MRYIAAALRAAVRWLGWWGLIALVLTLVGLAAWWRWDQARQVPLPAGAQGVTTQIVGALARQTTFAIAEPGAELRGFYRQALAERGWALCGTQATPGCTNLVAGDASVDVYRRADDAARSGTTVEISVVEAPGGATRVTVLEVNPNR